MMAATYKDVKRAREKKRLAIQDLKDQRACTKCDTIYPHYVLEWHHRDRNTKLFPISLASRNHISWVRILEEIAKCDLVCRNCHAELEWQGED